VTMTACSGAACSPKPAMLPNWMLFTGEIAERGTAAAHGEATGTGRKHEQRTRSIQNAQNRFSQMPNDIAVSR